MSFNVNNINAGPQNNINGIVNDNKPPIDVPQLKKTNAIVPKDVIQLERTIANLQYQNQQKIPANQIGNNNQIAVGKDWSFADADGIREIAENVTDKIKERIDGTAELDRLAEQIANKYDDKIKITASMAGKNELKAKKQELLNQINVIKEKRHVISSALPKDFKNCKDPLKALELIKKSLRVFRYDLQSNALDKGYQVNRMGIFERIFRAIQNLFTFGTDVKAIKPEDLDAIKEAEERLAALLQASSNDVFGEIKPEKNYTFASTLNETLQISHQTNNQIRAFQKQQQEFSDTMAPFKQVIENGGNRKVDLSLTVKALVGIGFDAVNLGLNAGAKISVTANVSCKGKGGPVTVTYTLAGGVTVGAKVEAAKDTKLFGGSAEANAGAGLTRSTAVTYASAEDFMLDAQNNKFAATRSPGKQFLHWIFSGLGILGDGVLCFGKFLSKNKADGLALNNFKYTEMLKEKNIIGRTDGVLLRRINPLIVEKRKSISTNANAGASAKFGSEDKFIKASLGLDYKYSREWKVKAHSYAPIAKNLRNAPENADLTKKLYLNPVTQQAPTIIPYKNLQQTFDNLIGNSDRVLEDKKAEEFANNIRTLMISTEKAVRDNNITREEGDKLLTRFSNFDVRLPVEIYRTYLMDTSQGSISPKIKHSVEGKYQVNLFNDMQKDYHNAVSELTNKSMLATIPEGIGKKAINDARTKLNLDTTIKYEVSFEKPNTNYEDPRPWENVHKKDITMTFSKSMYVNTLIEYSTRAFMVDQKGEYSAEEKSEQNKNAVKESLKLIIPNLILGFVKEGAKAQVADLLASNENIEAVVTTFMDNQNMKFGKLCGLALKNLVSKDAHDFLTNQSDKSIEELFEDESKFSAEHNENKVVKYSFVEGKLESVQVQTQNSDKLSINIEPKGVLVGVGFNFSYSVTENLKERSILVNSSMLTLLGQTEKFMLSDVTLDTPDKQQALKKMLTGNYKKIKDIFIGAHNNEQTKKLYDDALNHVKNDETLTNQLKAAWEACGNLNENTKPENVVNAAKDLLLYMTLAYRSALPPV